MRLNISAIRRHDLSQESVVMWHGGTGSCTRMIFQGRGHIRDPRAISRTLVHACIMADADRRWVKLWECWDAAELQILRAALEAGGVPVRTRGEHTHGVMGPLHGAALKARLFVPAAGVERAKAIATEIVGPFLKDSVTSSETKGSPFREPAEEPEEAEQERSPALIAPRKQAVLVLLAIASLCLPMMGVSQLYVRRPAFGIALWLLLVAIMVSARHDPRLALFILPLWLLDVISAAREARRMNRARALAASELDE